MPRRETLKTLILLAFAALALAFFLKAVWPAVLAALLLLAGSFDNIAGRAIAAGWMKFAEAAGKVNTRILLGLVFYLVLTPVAAAYRLFNRAAADHFRKDPGGSLFHDVHADPCARESFEKPW